LIRLSEKNRMADRPAVTTAASTPPWRNLEINIGKAFPSTLENLLVAVLLVLAVVTRLYGLGDRAASHDEVNHFIPAYDFSQGRTYIFDPMTHGPLQMHLITLSFVMLGDNDFTARLPAALFSIATVAIALFLFRRYLGRHGALIAGLLFLISPYMLYYGRYQRNEASIVVWSILTVYALLRFLESGEWKTLVLLTVVNAFHFTDKATGFIYAGGQVIFLAGYLLVRLFRNPRIPRIAKIQFLICMIVSAFLLGIAAHLISLESAMATPVVMYALPGIVIGVIGLAIAVVGLVLLWQAGREVVLRERSFDLILLLVTLILPLTSAAWMVAIGKFAGTTPPDEMYFATFWTIKDLPTFFQTLKEFFVSKILIEALLYIVPLAAAAIGIGVLWKGKRWLILAGIFYAIFLVLFTSLFNNPGGFFDGLVRFLGYWIVQHGEKRGGQPWFYFLFVQIPIYEYLPALGTIVAFFVALRRRLWSAASGRPFQPAAPENDESRQPVPTIPLLIFWALFNLAIFSYVGEKMPQHTMLIAAPMILAAAWALAYLVQKQPAGTVIRIGRAVADAAKALGYKIRGQAEDAAAGWAQWQIEIPLRNILLGAFIVLGLLTARTAYFAAYINYDYPNEYLAFAHGGTGPKIVLQEIERLSYLTTGGTGLVVAYDEHVQYSYWWYLRHYPNSFNFHNAPTADIRRAPVVLVSAEHNSKVVPILGEDYVGFRQVRMWWHNEDYKDISWDYIKSEYFAQARARGEESPASMSVGDYLRLAWGHVRPIFLEPNVRAAAFQIWLNRDFEPWGDVMQSGGYTIQDWKVRDDMYVYFRKDILDYLGGAMEASGGTAGAYDPYELSRIDLVPDFTLGGAGADPGQFAAPRGIAVAPDGSFYVADSMNHRIQHFDPAGNPIGQWGRFGSIDQGGAPGGTFNEPWGVGVGPDGSVYVADTWNHRVQKFTADGSFLAMWGAVPSAQAPGEVTFYGPRAVVVDSQGRVIVSDTGNKRILVFSSDGRLLTQFGSPGAGEGQLDEPVGLALDDQDRVYVADTWNRRVQIFAPQPDGTYSSVAVWGVNAWYGTTAEIKPYLAVDGNRHVYISDPSTCRILEFTERGVILSVWGECGSDGFSLNSPTGLAIDPWGGLWVSDSRNNRLVRYTLPNFGGGWPIR
jgi:uncharacterized protein (TIGR03663 family)